MEQKSKQRVAKLYSVLAACILWGISSTSTLVWAETPRINLQNTEISKLVEMVSRLTGKNFVLDQNVRGTVTFISGKGLTEEELYDAFLSILQVHGFEAVEAGNIIKIVPIGKALTTRVAPIIEVKPQEPPPVVPVDETITQVFQLQYIPAQTALQTLTPLAGQGETRIQMNLSSNALIVTGRGQNVERLGQVIRNIDKPNNQDVELVELRYSVASQLAQTLRELMGGGATPDGGAIPQRVRISVDERTNSILLAGDKADRERMRSIITRLDIPRTQPSETQVVPLKYAVASQLITTLKELQVTGTAADGKPVSRQVRIAADTRTNSILISGSRTEREPIVAAIARLDIPRARSGGTKVIPLRYAKAEDLVKVLSDTAKGIQQQTAGTVAGAPPTAAASSSAGSSGGDISIQADERTNAIIINAPAHIQNNLLKVVYQLDRRQAQVLIEAIIAEVSTDMTNRLGFGIAAFDAQGSSPGAIGSSNFGGLNTILSLAKGGISSIPSGLLFGVANNNFGAVLEALRGDGATNILSTPTIVTMDNKEASIVVGQNVPFVTGSYTNTSGSSVQNPFQTIQRQDVGLTLKVTPQINRGNTIQMKINQEVSSLASSSAGASDVITNKRSIDTNVMVEDGQILVLGGLIQDNFTDSEQKVPILSDLPIIGNAFKKNTTTKTKQNLMAFIHPIILPDREAADAYTRNKYHNLQRQQQESRVLSRGNVATGGGAAVFPNIECIDSTCAKGSADDLHFQQQKPSQPQTQVKRVAQTPQQQHHQQQRAAAQRQQQIRQQQLRQKQLERQHQQRLQQQRQRQLQQQRQQKLERQRQHQLRVQGDRGANADCVPGFCQMYE